MDGKITSSVDVSETPTENGQSNFGTDIDYQFSSEGQIIVVIDGSSIESDFSEGDTVKVWFDGSVEEPLPAIIPNVYKIELLN